ncbi:MAG: PIN domain-containing protein [Planctomycetota bacterium]
MPDRDDEPFLEAALATQAATLVTGNIKHFHNPDKPEPKMTTS